jgi:osmotically-inducible protein OsmY
MSLAIAGALAVGLTACDPQPTVDKLAKSVDNLVEPAGRDHDPARAPAPARQGMDQSAAAVPDAMLEERVKAALTADPGLRSVTVDVRSDHGVITLYGTADTPAKGHQAAMVALNVDGVRSVRNEMVIASGS